jgi:hypothetical protein
MPDNELNTLPQAEPAPVEPAAPETPIPAGEPPTDAAPDPSKVKDEIESLKEARKKAEEDAIYWRKQKAEARAEYFRDRGRGEEPPQPVKSAVVPEPKPQDFEDYNAYVSALTDHKVNVAKAEWERESERRNREQSTRERQETLHAKLQDGFTKYPDFEEVAFDRTATHITPMIVDILADCDAPADVAYYLAKNRVEGVAISRMTPVRAARAIAQIESKLTGQPVQPTPTKKISNAPPPNSPVGSKPSGITIDPEKMTNKEYARWREGQGARKF